MHRFGKCRMRKDHRQETFIGGLQVSGDTKPLDLFRDLCANHMRAQQFTCFSIENGLHKTLCLAAGQRLTIALIRELTDPDGPSPGQGRRFRQAETGNLGPGISATGHIVAIERGAPSTPASVSMQITPSWLALCARHGGPATSPMA